jgi:transposase-like protein
MEKPENGQRRHLTAEDKVSILRKHFLEKVPVSTLCEQHGLNPTVFYRWQKEFFENGAAAFERRSDGRERRLEERNAALEAKLAKKDAVMAELLEEHVALKKSLGEA